MILQPSIKIKAKPFLKWAGGKTQLLPIIDSFLPKSFQKENNITYIEPFVGGGAMLFFMLQKYRNIKHAIINDLNPHLVKAYKVIRDEPHILIDSLQEIQSKYQTLDGYENQKAFYIDIRTRFNTLALTDIETASYLIFMNRTCFNGLYRENSKGNFNVPFGKYSNPTICDASLILANSELLQKVEITHGDFSKTETYVNGYTFVYLDPPYRPLNATSNFNAYVKTAFDDSEQIRLRNFYVSLSEKGCHEILSNSDGKGYHKEDIFFDELYKDFKIERIYAKRSINANPIKRGYITELLIRNYTICQGIK